MRFKVIGANRNTGGDVALELEAPSPKDAEAAANALGVLVSGVKAATLADAPPTSSGKGLMWLLVLSVAANVVLGGYLVWSHFVPSADAAVTPAGASEKPNTPLSRDLPASSRTAEVPHPASAPPTVEKPIVASATTPKKKSQSGPKFPARMAYKHEYEIKSSYDKFKDYTSIDVEIPVTQYRQMHLFATFPGQTIAEAVDRVTVYFEPDCDSFDVIVDGDRWSALPSRSASYDLHFLDLPIANFIKLANATRVEARACEEFELKVAQLEALKDFASRLTP